MSLGSGNLWSRDAKEPKRTESVLDIEVKHTGNSPRQEPLERFLVGIDLFFLLSLGRSSLRLNRAGRLLLRPWGGLRFGDSTNTLGISDSSCRLRLGETRLRYLRQSVLVLIRSGRETRRSCHGHIAKQPDNKGYQLEDTMGKTMKQLTSQPNHP